MKKILISAGHSDRDPGAPGRDFSATEARLALELRDLIVSEFSLEPSSRFEITTDGRIGENLPLSDACLLIAGKDTAIEIHFNAATNPVATGVEVIALPAKKVLAQKLAAGISACLGLKLRGAAGWIDQSQSARGKLGFVQRGGLILEVCFISNLDDYVVYQSKKQLLAKVLAEILKS